MNSTIVENDSTPNFDIQPYSGKNSIIEVLKQHNSNGLISHRSIHNSHFAYLESYFREIKVKTIVYEFDYNDREYIQDFAHHYCRSFRDYSKKCVRLHFFTTEIPKDEFIDFLKTYIPLKNGTKNDNPYYDFYAGFTVLRPIALFGRTCLKTYPPEKDDGTRYYPTTKEYKIHLFGIEFSVRSVAFQEQDKAVAACATTGLWVAFQKTSQLFEHVVPTPFDITLNASKYMMPSNSKQVPYEQGLHPYQMTYAITQQGLQPLVTNPYTTSYSKAQIYAYLKCEIPVILGVSLFEKKSTQLKKPAIIGKHAITALGYDRISNWKPKPFIRPVKRDSKNKKDFYLVSSSIQEIYVHDDQNFSLYFDATDISNSDFFLFALHTDFESYTLIKDRLNESVTKRKELISYENNDYPFQMKKIIQHYLPERFDPAIAGKSYSGFDFPGIIYKKDDLIEELKDTDPDTLQGITGGPHREIVE